MMTMKFPLSTYVVNQQRHIWCLTFAFVDLGDEHSQDISIAYTYGITLASNCLVELLSSISNRFFYMVSDPVCL